MAWNIGDGIEGGGGGGGGGGGASKHCLAECDTQYASYNDIDA